jgi:hypothetical protein
MVEIKPVIDLTPIPKIGGSHGSSATLLRIIGALGLPAAIAVGSSAV